MRYSVRILLHERGVCAGVPDVKGERRLRPRFAIVVPGVLGKPPA